MFFCDPPNTCSQVDHGCCACCDSIHLRMDFMFGLVHLVFAPGFGCLEQSEKEKNDLLSTTISILMENPTLSVMLTASVPRGGRESKSSREAWAAWTACMLELMVPVRACCADVCGCKEVPIVCEKFFWQKLLTLL